MTANCYSAFAFSALTLLVGRQEGHPACKKQWWGTGVVVCLEQGADLHTVQLMPLPLTVSRSSNIQIGFTFLVPAYPGCPGKEAVKWLLLLLLFCHRWLWCNVFACSAMEVDEPSKVEADTAATETAKPTPVLVRLDASLLLWLSCFFAGAGGLFLVRPEFPGSA